MEIEYTVIYTKNPEKIKEFFVKYFGTKEDPIFKKINSISNTFVLTFDGGQKLKIMDHLDHEQQDCRKYKVAISISVGGFETVNRLTLQLKNDGYSLYSGTKALAYGYLKSCIVLEQGILIELVI